MASAGGIVANSRRIATALCILYGLLFAARMTLAFATGSLNDQNELWFNVASAVLLASFPLLFLAVGYAIVVRQPRNTIGWLGTTVSGSIPVRSDQAVAASHADSSRSGPNADLGM